MESWSTKWGAGGQMCCAPRSVNWNNHIPWSQFRSSQQQRAAASCQPLHLVGLCRFGCAVGNSGAALGQSAGFVSTTALDQGCRVSFHRSGTGQAQALEWGNLGFNKGKSFALLWCICQHLAEPWRSSAGPCVKGKQQMSTDGFVRARGLSDLILPDIG